MPSTHRYLALLRGINVGGHNIISKDDLKRCFENLGMSNVRTYIQSGNILFRSSSRSMKSLTSEIEWGLSQSFHYDARAVVLSHRRYNAMMDAAPKQWGADDDYRHNVLFTMGRTTSTQVLAKLPDAKPEIEIVAAAPGAVFWSISKSHLTRSSFAKLPQHKAIYQDITIRNHNTARKLQSLFDEI